MKELKVKVGVNDDNKITSMEPVNKASGKTVDTQILTARLLTQDEIDRETEELMQEGCRVYKRKRGRIREIK